MSGDLYTLIGYQVEATTNWRRPKLNTFPTMAGIREQRKSLSGSPRKLII
jgi:hypothetical protein